MCVPDHGDIVRLIVNTAKEIHEGLDDSETARNNVQLEEPYARARGHPVDTSQQSNEMYEHQALRGHRPEAGYQRWNTLHAQA